jgi:hypothetical protein
MLSSAAIGAAPLAKISPCFLNEPIEAASLDLSSPHSPIAVVIAG